MSMPYALCRRQRGGEVAQCRRIYSVPSIEHEQGEPACKSRPPAPISTTLTLAWSPCCCSSRSACPSSTPPGYAPGSPNSATYCEPLFLTSANCRHPRRGAPHARRRPPHLHRRYQHLRLHGLPRRRLNTPTQLTPTSGANSAPRSGPSWSSGVSWPRRPPRASVKAMARDGRLQARGGAGGRIAAATTAGDLGRLPRLAEQEGPPRAASQDPPRFR